MSSTPGIHIQVGGASLAVPVVEPICQLYDAVFSQPPFFWRDDEPQLHRDRLQRLLQDPTFGLALAWQDRRLVGFAYGFTLPADTTRWTALTEPVAPEIAAEWPGRTFVLFDFAVEAGGRGRGTGKRLHDGLLGARHEERTTLTVQPVAVETKAIYERWQWYQVGQIEGGPTGAAPVFDVYLRPTLEDLHRTHSMP